MYSPLKNNEKNYGSVIRHMRDLAKIRHPVLVRPRIFRLTDFPRGLRVLKALQTRCVPDCP